MQKAAGLAEASGLVGKEGDDISPSADVVDVSEDDVALMMASAEIPGVCEIFPSRW